MQLEMQFLKTRLDEAEHCYKHGITQIGIHCNGVKRYTSQTGWLPNEKWNEIDLKKCREAVKI